MAKILIIEDDVILSDQLVNWLEAEHYNCEQSDDGLDGLEKLTHHKYDVIVIDWELPRLSGVEIVRKFRAGGGVTPILILTGKGRVQDKEEGLNAGADDYLTKPFELRELTARLKALLRRPAGFAGMTLEGGGLTADTTQRRVFCNGTEISLQAKEFDLLEFLLRHQGKVLKTQELLEHVWSSDSFVTSETLYTYIRALRKKIEDAGGQNVIHTVRAVGYILRLPD